MICYLKNERDAILYHFSDYHHHHRQKNYYRRHLKEFYVKRNNGYLQKLAIPRGFFGSGQSRD
jgi:hypothetical protein